jgi:effector-binding domain-containing protein
MSFWVLRWLQEQVMTSNNFQRMGHVRRCLVAFVLGSAVCIAQAVAPVLAQTSAPPAPQAPSVAAPSVSAPNVATPSAPAAPEKPTPPAVAPASSAPSELSPQAPPAAKDTPAGALPASPQGAAKDSDPMLKPSGDASNGRMVELAAKPALVLSGSADWEDGWSTIFNAITKIRNEIKKLNLNADGRPLSVFLDTDDQGFKFEVMVPLTAAPEGGATFTGGIKLGKTPAGKAMIFEHRGPYDDIDSTYEAITAYLDEKGIDAQNRFVEQYLNDPRGSDDVDAQVDIFVFMR